MKKWPFKASFFRPAPIKRFAANKYSQLVRFVEKRPLTTFFTLLIVLFALIIVGNTFRKPPIVEEPKKEPIKVDVYRIGVAPRIKLNAQVQKSKTVKIMAQAPGVVTKINVVEGQNIAQGQNILSLSSNYQGGNILSAQRELASRQYQNVNDTFGMQKDLIVKQRDLANEQRTSTEDLRKITEQSLGDTRTVISINEEILTTLDKNIQTLEDNNTDEANDPLILQTKQLKSQLLSATSQLRTGLRQAELQTDTSKSPTNLANIQKDIALKQLDLQEKALNVSRDTALIQLKIAQINEATMFPGAPFGGKIDKIYVRVGQQVTPGMPIAQLSGVGNQLTAVAQVPGDIARAISQLDPSFVEITGERMEVSARYISKEATDGQLYSVTFPLDASYTTTVADLQYVNVDVPIGYANTSKNAPFVPLDSIHQTQDAAFVFTIVDNHAKAIKVTLGEVNGSYIGVTSGLDEIDTIIASRNVLDGDQVTTQ